MLLIKRQHCWLYMVCCIIYALPAASQTKEHTRFIKHVITPDFISEGAAAADINKDGKTDIIAGAYWFEAPAWKKHSIAPPVKYDPSTAFSNSFLNFILDVNSDGWPDQIRISLPGEEAVWYENPGNRKGYWTMHAILNNAGNESPAFVDINGDGRLDLLCNDPVAKEMVWMQAPVLKADTNWVRHVIAKGETGTNRYTHGLGWADMNADGRKDVLITNGWWECPADPYASNWVFHAADLGEECSQIYKLGEKGDEANQFVSASAHNYGIWWHEKSADAHGNAVWRHHTVFDKFSQSHGLALVDVNKDGHPDLVTGKRYFAHNGKDPGALEPSVLYWFEYKPGKTPAWIPHLVDDHSGAGLQVVVQDINKDGSADIVVANKNGVFFFEQAAH